MQDTFRDNTHGHIFERWHIRGVCDEAAGHLALQRGLLSAQRLVVHVIYKHTDISYPPLFCSCN